LFLYGGYELRIKCFEAQKSADLIAVSLSFPFRSNMTDEEVVLNMACVRIGERRSPVREETAVASKTAARAMPASPDSPRLGSWVSGCSCGVIKCTTHENLWAFISIITLYYCYIK
jgi:hypothetical protein